jgi:hypothetical protein
MWFQEAYQRLVNRPRTRRQTWPQTRRRHRARLGAEQLEDRQVLSSFTAATVSDLIADINAANRQGSANTIALTAPATSPSVLTSVDNTTNGTDPRNWPVRPYPQQAPDRPGITSAPGLRAGAPMKSMVRSFCAIGTPRGEP